MCQMLFQSNQKFVELIRNLPLLEKQLPSDVKMVLVYISRYDVRHESDNDDTCSIYLQHGSYLNIVNRGGLKIPGDCVCQWVFFCYIIFHNLVKLTCRTFLCRIL